MQHSLIIHRLRVYPGMCSNTDTVCDVYLDLCQDIAVHPLYCQRSTPRVNDGTDKNRHRSMPVRRLVSELASNLNLEPDSLANDAIPESGRGTILGRPNGMHSTLLEVII